MLNDRVTLKMFIGISKFCLHTFFFVITQQKYEPLVQMTIIIHVFSVVFFSKKNQYFGNQKWIIEQGINILLNHIIFIVSRKLL